MWREVAADEVRGAAADTPLTRPGDGGFDERRGVGETQVIVATEADELATVDHGGPITAVVGRANLAGTQFHPEKSQATGLRLIANFLRWTP